MASLTLRTNRFSSSETNDTSRVSSWEMRMYWSERVRVIEQGSPGKGASVRQATLGKSFGLQGYHTANTFNIPDGHLPNNSKAERALDRPGRRGQAGRSPGPGPDDATT